MRRARAARRPDASSAAAATLLGLGLLATAHLACASPDEAWITRAPVPADSPPLLVLLLDASTASAIEMLVPPEYDPGTDYAALRDAAARCDPRRVYWRRGPGPAPRCADNASVPLAAATPTQGFRCDSAMAALASTGVFVAARAAQWRGAGMGGYWGPLVAGDDAAVECREDRGRHGHGAGQWYAVNVSAGPWGDDPADEARWDAPPLAEPYVFFHGNYLNFLAVAKATTPTTLHDWMRARLVTAARSVDALQLALVGPDLAAGGDATVLLPPTPAPAAAAELEALLRAGQPGGSARIAGLVAAAGRWMAAAGGAVDDRKRSAFPAACRAVSVGLLSPGVPAADDDATRPAIELGALPAGQGRCVGSCLVELLRWLQEADLQGALPGRQFARTLALTGASPTQDFEQTLRAARVPAQPLQDPLALVMLFARALRHDAAVPGGPTISAPAIDRSTPTLPGPGLFYGIGEPAPQGRWVGNLLAYDLQAVATLTSPASAGAPRQSLPADDLWSPEAAAGPRSGGAAAQLPGPTRRQLYTDLTSDDLTAAGNRIAVANELLDAAAVGLSAGEDARRRELIDWTLGRDVFDADFDGDVSSARRELGDPGLAAPLLLRYGTEESDAALVFTLTADGLLHALDARNGEERWAFLPYPLLHRLPALARAADAFSRPAGLQAPLAKRVIDANADGRLSRADGDRAWLYLSLGPAAPHHYALDVTDPDRPRILWTIGPSQLPWLEPTRATPVVTRLPLGPAGRARDVVLLAGGTSARLEAGLPPAAGSGAGFAIVDAENGAVLLTAGNEALADVEVMLPGAAAIASAPRAVDTDRDGVSDRLYLLDVGGGLWRIDWPGGGAAASVRRLGSFGDPGGGAPARQFHAAPDVVLTERAGRPALLLAFGSGSLTHPRERTGTDAFFAVFDQLPTRPAQRHAPLVPEDLVDVTAGATALPADAAGWILRLDAHGAGEKVIGSALTVDGRVRFTTYQPLAPSADQPCGPPRAVSRLYTLDVQTGRPANYVDDEPEQPEELPTAGLPPALRIAFGIPAGAAAAGRARPVGLLADSVIELDWLNTPVRTSWRELDLPAE